MRDVFLFAGPTLARARLIQPDLPLTGVTVLPPVQRGDLPRLTQEREPGVAVIVDGKFHQVLAVGHIEIRNAMARGWEVWGLASLGAIRAREMHHLGMRGFGRVFELYLGEGDFRDDEVTLLHESEPPYRELSEPMVHLRLALLDLAEKGVIPRAAADALVRELMDTYFGDRTLGGVRQRLQALVAPDQEPLLASFFAGFDRYRVKSLDLIEFLVRRPWEAKR